MSNIQCDLAAFEAVFPEGSAGYMLIEEIRRLRDIVTIQRMRPEYHTLRRKFLRAERQRGKLSKKLTEANKKLSELSVSLPEKIALAIEEDGWPQDDPTVDPGFIHAINWAMHYAAGVARSFIEVD